MHARCELMIVWYWMQLVPAVTELIVAELLYLQYKDRQKPIYLYINSTGTTRADGETVSADDVELIQHSLHVCQLFEFKLACVLVRPCHVCESSHSHAGGL